MTRSYILRKFRLRKCSLRKLSLGPEGMLISADSHGPWLRKVFGHGDIKALRLRLGKLP